VKTRHDRFKSARPDIATNELQAFSVKWQCYKEAYRHFHACCRGQRHETENRNGMGHPTPSSLRPADLQSNQSIAKDRFSTCPSPHPSASAQGPAHRITLILQPSIH